MNQDDDVRPARADDLADLVRMLEEWTAATPIVRAGYLSGFPRRHILPRQRFTEAMASDDGAVFVGLLETHTVGFALLRLDHEMPEGLLARVEELYVEPEARELGLGESLLDACVQWAEVRGCSGIDIEALPGARSAKNLAERSGFTARLLVLHRKLG